MTVDPRMSYEELTELEDALVDVLRGRALEEKHGLGDFDTPALKILQEAVSDALDNYAEAEAAYERQAYERSV